MSIKTIGVMTGNSLDAVDTVLTEFNGEQIKDLASCSIRYSAELRNDILRLRAQIASHNSETNFLENNPFFERVLKNYTLLVAQAINTLCEQSGVNKAEIAAIGWHGQTCDHFPPSIAAGQPPYTLQISDPLRLADLTGLPVIYDFRSDDLMNGGEGAPLAPVHNKHIAYDLKNKGAFPVAFCNAGNTGNITIISEKSDGNDIVQGWDVGPFNHFADMLVRMARTDESFDRDGRYGKQGEILPDLLGELFNAVAVTNEGKNFYLKQPPKSSDPSWYRLDLQDVQREYGFKNTLRTIEYLSAYTFFHTLSFIGQDVQMPQTFLLFGGGWKNPLILEDFKQLTVRNGVVLPQHEDVFANIRKRFTAAPEVDFSDKYGYSGAYMEARIFADMARCRITGEPFSFPENTGCRTPTVAGLYVLPDEQKPYLLTELFNQYGTADLVNNDWSKKYNRAAKGWQTRN